MAGVVTTLGAIRVGTDGAGYTPDRVVRVAEFTTALAPLDSSFRTLYYVRPGTEERRLGLSTCEVSGDLEVFVLAARLLEEASERPGDGTSDARGKAQAELAADVCFRIFQLPTFGVQNARLLQDSIRVEYDNRWIAKWANVEVRFVVRYLYSRPNELNASDRR